MPCGDGDNAPKEKYLKLLEFAIKMKTLWNSGENYIYGLDKEKIRKYIPDIKDYRYVPVNNSMLAKAEIPFLIFEKNRGKCFIEQY